MALTAAQRRRIPTYKFADTANRKYPLDTEKRVRAAVSYFSKPSNARKYPLSERKKIWSRITRAAKKYRITLSDHAGPPSLEKRPRKRSRSPSEVDRAKRIILKALRKEGGGAGKALLRRLVREGGSSKFDAAYRELKKEKRIFQHLYGDIILR